MGRIIIYAFFIGVLVLGIGAGYHNSSSTCNDNYISQDIYSSADLPGVVKRTDPMPVYFDSYSSAHVDSYLYLRVDPAPWHFMEGIA